MKLAFKMANYEIEDGTFSDCMTPVTNYRGNMSHTQRSSRHCEFIVVL